MLQELKSLQASLGFDLCELNIGDHPELQESYRIRIPYLFVGGRPFAKGHLDARKLKRRLFWNRLGIKIGPLPDAVRAAASRDITALSTDDSTNAD